jgi:hypothetical protein
MGWASTKRKGDRMAAQHSRIHRNILCAIILCLIGLPAAGQYGGGTGEPNNPYLIYTAEQMNAIGAEPNDWDKRFKLMADIDLAGLGGVPFNIIAIDPNHAFTGVFDGNAHTISNLTYHRGGVSNVGLFGYIGDPNAKIVNLGLVRVDMDAGSADFVGSLVGYIEEGVVANCFAEGGRVVGRGGVGGLVGCNRGTIANSYATCAVVGEMCVGGLAGGNGPCGRGGDTPCHSGTISACYSLGSVIAAEFVGGLVGFPLSGGVRSSFWNVETSGQETSAGGTGKSSAEMRDPNTFRAAGWDFFGATDGPSEVWTTDPTTGYPILWWQVPETQWPQLSHFSGGAGKPQDPYLIATAQHLNSIGHSPRLMNAHFRLTNDIDLGDTRFFSIGSEATPFAGVFDGCGAIISNYMHVSENGYAMGMFGYVDGENARIEALTLASFVVDVNAGECTGSLIGRLHRGDVTDCHVEGGAVAGDFSTGGMVGRNDFGRIVGCQSTVTVTGRYDTGGLIGWDQHGQITDCYSSACVTGRTSVGGIIGVGWRSTLANCHTTGVIAAEYGVGGLVGETGGATLVDCYSTSVVSGGSGAGGLVGHNFADIAICYATGPISGDQAIGGVAGYNEGAISDCHATGPVTGNTVVGGLVGGSFGSVNRSYSTGTVHGAEWSIGGLIGSNDGRITSCYSTGNVEGDFSVGGLAGWNSSQALNCYATGSVTGADAVGGLIGRNYHIIKNCYATGKVECSGNGDVGGLVGFFDDWYDGLVEGSFWDVQTSGWAAGEHGTGKTTAQMYMATTFLDAGWDFVDETTNGTEDVWWIAEGQDYPRLSWERQEQP